MRPKTSMIPVVPLAALLFCAAVPARAQQIPDAQVCINPQLVDPVIKGVQARNVADIPANPAGMDALIKGGKHLKGLTNAQLVSRTPSKIVCRYDSTWDGGRPGVADTTAKFIIEVTSGANGSASIDAHLE